MKQTIRRVLPLACGLLAMFCLFNIDLKGYVTNGHTWGTNQVLYYINPSNIYMSDTAAISAIQKGAAPWSSQTLANIQLVYAGATNGSSLTLNNKNEVFFRNDSSSYIGETYWWYDYTGHLVDADTVFHENWHFYSGSGCTGSGVYLEDSAVHELGHALGLGHSGTFGATMYATMPSTCDLTQLTLESDDISGIEALYPPTSTNKNTAPAVSISSPGNGSAFANGATVSFAASATDSQDGNLTSSIAWTSSIDGAIGSGGSFSRTLSAGSHVITALVRDSGGLTGSTQVTISVAAASTQTASPDGTTVPTATQIIDNGGAVWTLTASNAVLRNGSSVGYGTKILWKSSTIYVLGTDGNWYQWTGSGWVNVGPTTPTSTTTSSSTTSTTTSPDGTTVPTATQIIDNGGAVWTVTASNAVLRNGSSVGYGTKILWKSSTIYVLGTDGNWYQWTGSGWINVGPTTPTGTTTSSSTTSTTTPDGTTVPTATQIIDNSGAVWTLTASNAVLRNGSSVGYGTKILWKSSTIYVLGTDANWYRWTGSGWINVGPTTPTGTTTSSSTTSTTTSPDGTTVPTATQIIDNGGAVWTVTASNAVLRNGSSVGYGTKILWKSSTIYVLGTDGNWYQWTGSGWINVGPTTPTGTTTSSSTTSTTTPDGTTVPTATQIIDNGGAVWTLTASNAVLRNGSSVGYGTKILWKSSTIYVYGTDGNWWKWTGSGWVNIGPIQP